MSRRIRQTSLEAFEYVTRHVQAPAQRAVVLAIREFNTRGICPTDREITQQLGYGDPNKVRPRRRELALEGVIFAREKRRCSVTGRNALGWCVT